MLSHLKRFGKHLFISFLPSSNVHRKRLKMPSKIPYILNVLMVSPKNQILTKLTTTHEIRFHVIFMTATVSYGIALRSISGCREYRPIASSANAGTNAPSDTFLIVENATISMPAIPDASSSGIKGILIDAVVF